MALIHMIQSKAMAAEDHHQATVDSHSNKDREGLAFKMDFHLAVEVSLVEANLKCISIRLTVITIIFSLLYHTHHSFYISFSSTNKLMFLILKYYGIFIQHWFGQTLTHNEICFNQTFCGQVLQAQARYLQCKGFNSVFWNRRRGIRVKCVLRVSSSREALTTKSWIITFCTTSHFSGTLYSQWLVDNMLITVRLFLRSSL